MHCASCELAIHFTATSMTHAVFAGGDSIAGIAAAIGLCPSCGKPIVALCWGAVTPRREDGALELIGVQKVEVLYPTLQARHQVAPEVPTDIAGDLREAHAVLPASAKASAALSRRLLQRVLREKHGVKPLDLAKEIDEFLARPGIPTYLSDAIDAVRNVGNIAAHPVADLTTGGILPVEPGEAEWLLEVVDALLDFSYVQPTRLDARRHTLNSKLATAGKPPLK